MEPIPAIERHAPVPRRLHQKYPFDVMLPGESFLVSKDRRGLIANAISNQHRRYPEKQFTYRTMPDGVRVWRVQ